MDLSYRNVTVLCIVLLFITTAVTPIIISVDSLEISSFEGDSEKQLVLLRGEHILVLKALDDTNLFHVKYSFPPDYNYQVPVLFEILNDTTANILDYSIENGTSFPNKVVNFTIASIGKDDSVSIHFYYWVLVKNHEYDNLPGFVRIPRNYELPHYTKKWLVPTDVVQSDNILIRIKALQLRGLNDNLLSLAYKIAKFSRQHRYILFLLQYNLGRYGSQDALTTLFINGECPGRSHLGCALFRANNVPARVILATPSYSFWYQIHCMTEYYLPGYGWVLTEVHGGETPYEPKNQIIMRICYPEDENSTHTDYIFKNMKGVENWFWIDDDNVQPYYADLEEGSKSTMFKEKEVLTDKVEANYVFYLTKNVFNYYQKYLGFNLTGNDIGHFQNATNAQKKAIDEFKDNSNAQGYISNMIYSYDEYAKIST